MLEVGQIFNKEGKEFCVIDIIDFNYNKYVLFSVEDEKIDYLFYELKKVDNIFNLNLVTDDEINFQLFRIVEGKNE